MRQLPDVPFLRLLAAVALSAPLLLSAPVSSDDLEALRRAAAGGDIRAQMRFAQALDLGSTRLGVTRDEKQATHWYEQAARQGDADAQFALAVRHAIGEGAPLDSRAAAEWFRKAAEQGHPHAQYQFAMLLESGDGVARDLQAAWRWLERAARSGHQAASDRLTEPRAEPDSVADEEQRTATAAAIQVDRDLELAFAYGLGDLVEREPQRAAAHFRRSAELGDAEAQFNLGAMLEAGDGAAVDLKSAVAWYRRAAEQGHLSALVNLGLLYDDGRGVEQDRSEAARLFRLAAERGHAAAQFNLGAMYDSGDGVGQDVLEAVRWYGLAAEQGDAGAQLNLAAKFAAGEGVPVDYVLAYKWVNLASTAGDPEIAARAFENRTLLSKHMTPEQIAEGQRLARDVRLGRSKGPSDPDEELEELRRRNLRLEMLVADLQRRIRVAQDSN